MKPDSPPPTGSPHQHPNDPPARAAAILRALKKHRTRLKRKLEAIRGDLAEAERAREYRRLGEALLAYLNQVPARASKVTLPDPADPARGLEIALDPGVKPQANAARYFRRAAKGERGLKEIPPRLSALEAAIESLTALIERAEASLEATPSKSEVPDPATVNELEIAFDRLPPNARRDAGVRPLRGGAAAAGAQIGPVARRAAELPAKLQPRRLKTAEVWDVLIGRSNEGNDYVTLHLARPEDYWFHVHGTPGSHVVLRRGKSKDEPSKQTLLEVAAWTAFYSQSRTAGTVPVIYTRKKYVRKPRKSPVGTVTCEREKTLMVKPKEPPRAALASEAPA